MTHDEIILRNQLLNVEWVSFSSPYRQCPCCRGWNPEDTEKFTHLSNKGHSPSCSLRKALDVTNPISNNGDVEFVEPETTI